MSTTRAVPRSRASLFRSAALELRVDSQRVQALPAHGSERQRTIPILGPHDAVTGAVAIDPQFCRGPGRLTLTLEGMFTYIAPVASQASAQATARVFLSHSEVLEMPDPPSPRTPLLRKTSAILLRPSAPPPAAGLQHMSSAPGPVGRRVRDFHIALPAGPPGEALPPSFSRAHRTPGRASAERAEVSYRLIVRWEPLADPAKPTQHAPTLEAPVLILPDADVDTPPPSPTPSAWIEVPLHADRPLPFACAVTLPQPAMFPRAGAAAAAMGAPDGVPYFVVFSTTARNAALACELAEDATIAVSLVRVVTLGGQPAVAAPEPEPTPATPLSAPPGAFRWRRRPRGGSGSAASAPSSPVDPPDVPVPLPAVVDTRTLQTSVCVGFPRRPRHPPEAGKSGELPDGLCQGRLPLAKGLLPGVKWAGLRVKYYLDVSVLFGQDELRARVPIQIY